MNIFKAILIFISATALSTLAACNDGTDSDSELASRMCKKISSCIEKKTTDQLSDCEVTATAGLDELTDDDVAQITKQANVCLELSCSGFQACYEAITYE